MPETITFCSNCGTQNSSSAQQCGQCGAALAAIPVAPAALSRTRYGGFWIRFVAVIIDGIVVELVVFPLSLFIGALIGLAGFAVRMPGVGIHLVGMIVGVVIGTLAGWLYEALMESSSKQATLGKMALGLKVTTEYGARISFARATGRHFAKYLSAMVMMIGYIIAGFTERKQALHDFIAGTLVVRA